MNDLIQLSEVCTKYFGVTERIAKRKASQGKLPVPVFRLTGTKRGPIYIHQSDLDAYIQRQRNDAKKLNSHMREAGLV